ncbi:Transposon Tn10 TetD protein [Acaryochloris thomasi RCC1774]|uniref:Transposon Tn10 TetD protein n=1 Tax=Acaryochloris thomasi RCC1774 TaxID=1764569 RepID=A0A2W1JID7_9CYAN|nr:AraC family transcriptional regulator [Acaryochloris thomasi]PZD73259.1 Transposon Tn10 TetD protein [Acaryochloris thomasi RCC1774]
MKTNARQTPLRSPSLRKQTWSGIGSLRYQSNCLAKTIPEHDHASHALFISLGGSTWLNMPSNGYNQMQRLPAGSIAITPARVMHSAVVDEPSEFIILYLRPEFVDQSGERTANHSLKPVVLQSDSLIQAISTTLTKADSEEGDRFYAESLLHALSNHLLKRYSWQPSAQQFKPSGLSAFKLTRVRDYIEAHLQESIRLDDLAMTSNLSRYHFCRLFKQSVGTSPYRYILQQRIKKAKQLLRDPELSLVEVALTSGFANQSHFSRHFRQQVGVTPSYYRHQAR